MASPTTSSPATSPDPEPVVVGEYTAADDAEALALERLCPQGDALQLSFRRARFDRRAENFARHALFTARSGGALVGVAAIAVKDVTLFGRPTRAEFGFDLRVHPLWRGRGLGRKLLETAVLRFIRDTTFAYTYSVADNRAARALVEAYGTDVGGYAYLVYPVFRRRPVAGSLSYASAQEVHAALLLHAPKYDLLSDPFDEGRCTEIAEAWLLRRGRELAGCSAWDNRDVLAEVIERVPSGVRVLGRLQRLVPGLPLPRVPAPGEELHSWYLFDFFATGGAIARDLMRLVAAHAADHGVRWCYVPHVEGDDWVDAIRSDVPRAFAPIVRYRLLMGHHDRSAAAPIRRPYVDIRDL